MCKPKKDGGLGIRPLALMNQALLGKWLWRVGSESESLWRQLIVSKYSIKREGWEVESGVYKYSAIWKGICSVKEKFVQNIKFSVCSGNKIFFWFDTWVGDCPLKVKFPNLFSCAMDKEAKVGNCMEKIRESICLVSHV